MTKKKLILIITIALLLLTVIAGICVRSINSSPYERQLALGYKYFEEGNYEEAILAFNKAIEIAPKKYEAYLALSDTYVAMGDFESARKILEQGIEATGSKKLKDALSKLSSDKVIEQEFDFETEVVANNLNVDAENLKVNVKDGRTATITVSGIDVKDTYITNLSTTKKDDSECFWRVEMYGNEKAYSVSTAWWAFEPGLNEEKAVSNMQHSVWYFDGNSWPMIGDAAMTYTSNSITWTFSIPDEYPFDFSKVTRYEVCADGVYQQPGIKRIYNVK